MLEIIFVLAGIYAVFKGEVPGWLFGGGGKYEIKGMGARLLGLYMASTLPIVFVLSILGYTIWGDSFQNYGLALECAVVLFVAATAAVISYMIRKPVQIVDSEGNITPPDADHLLEAEISRKVNGSMIYIILGGLGMGGFILCPLAFYRIHWAIQKIEERNIGTQHLGRAKVMRIIAGLLSVFWIAVPAMACAFIFFPSLIQ